MSPSDIAVIKTEIIYLTAAVTNLSNSLIDHMEKEELHMREEEEAMKEIIKSLDEKYAAKWVERVLTFVGT
jgi:molecular chaperone DnaK (HSP70)